MDPLDQRLTDAGAAWRQSQPEPPDLDRLVRGLDRRRSRAFSPRLGFLFAAGLLVLAAVAVAPGVGGIFNRPQNALPVGTSSSPVPTATASIAVAATPSVTPAATPTPAPSATATSTPSDTERATALLDAYEAALVAGEWQTAFDMLAPASPTHEAGVDAYAAERAPYFASVSGRYTIGAPIHDVPDWTTYAPLIDGADTSRAYVIEVDYPALSGNNAGYEEFVVAPDATGTWWIWPVR